MFSSAPEIEIIKTHHRRSAKLFYPSAFAFLRSINGLRPGCLHGLLAPSSAGKSTLCRSIIAQTTETAKTGVILSEEKALEYASGFYAQCESVTWDNLRFIRESDIVELYPTKEEQIKAIVSFAIEHDIKVLVWDNITTGIILGDSVRPAEMAKLLEVLKHELFVADIAMLFVAHTNKNVKAEQSTPFQGEDIRGSNQYFMKADYFFNLQIKTKNNIRAAFVKISKHRFHQPESIYYMLKFKGNRYIKDECVSYDDIMNLFQKDEKSGNKLSPRRY